MGIERIVTDEMVFEVADRLAAAGDKVSNRALWNAIGGGSMTTISQALRRWRERQELRAESPVERVPLPAAVAEVMHDAVSRLWQAAQVETQAELDQLTQAANIRVGEAHGERDEALAELQATVEELEQVRTARDEAVAESARQAEAVAIAQADIERLRAELAAQGEALATALHRADTAEAARTELHARVGELAGLLGKEQSARAHAETDAQMLRVERATLSAKLDAAESQAGTAEKDMQRARREAESACVAEQACQARLESAARELVDLREQVREEKAAAKKAGEAAAELRGQLAVLNEHRGSAAAPRKKASKVPSQPA